MKLVVTGAGGFLGAAIAATAARAGHQVVAVARQVDPERLRPLGDAVARRVIDVTDGVAVERLLAAERPDIVVHSAWAGLTRTERDGAGQLVQLNACLALVQAAARAGVGKFIGIGSQAEYGGTTGRTDEDALPRPISLYGATKLAAGVVGARLAAEAGMAFAWARLFAVYGPGDNPTWLIPSILAQLLRGERPRMSPGTQRVDYLFIDDAAAAVLAVATRADAVGTFNLASGHAVTVRALVEQLRDLARPDLSLTFGDVPFGPDQVMHIEGAIDRLSAATGWRPATSLHEGLARTVAAARA